MEETKDRLKQIVDILEGISNYSPSPKTKSRNRRIFMIRVSKTLPPYFK
jgi:hypothetical protein